MRQSLQPLRSLSDSLLRSLLNFTLCGRAWDMRPYAPQNRCVKLFSGHTHNFEKSLIKCDWSADGTRVACGR